MAVERQGRGIRNEAAARRLGASGGGGLAAAVGSEAAARRLGSVPERGW
jgi:hypothetical protein